MRVPQFLVFSLLLCGSVAAHLDRVGPEFQINTTAGLFGYAALSRDSNGNFVVVWASVGFEFAPAELYGQRFSASSLAIGHEFAIPTSFLRETSAPSVSTSSNGDFSVAWVKYDLGYEIVVRLYDSAGRPRSQELVVSSSGTYATTPAISASPKGGFVVVWSHEKFYSSIIEVLGQRLDDSGANIGVPVRLNSFVAGEHRSPRVLHHRDHGFTVVWNSFFAETPKRGGIQLRRFDGRGRPEGDEQRVTTAGQQGSFSADAAYSTAGDMIVVWTGGQNDVRARWFNGRGHPISEEFIVAQSAGCYDRRPRVAGDIAGNFLIVWEHRWGQGLPEAYGRRINPAGRPAGRTVILRRGKRETFAPEVSSLGPLEFAVVWLEARSTEARVMGQRFRIRR